MEEIEEYFKRSVIDISRRCHVFTSQVIKVIKEFVENDSKRRYFDC